MSEATSNNESFPTTAEGISAGYLTKALQTSGVLKDASVAAVSFEMIGTGKMGDNARLSIAYEGGAGTAPATMIAKLPAADEQARGMAGAQGAYYSEVMFYRELAPGTSMRTPAIYASELSEDRTNFLLLMEDMSPAAPGSQLVGESFEHTRMAMSEAAKFAASYYGRDDLGSRDHIMTAARDDGGEFGQALMQEYWPVFVDRFGHGLNADTLQFGERYAQNHAHFVTRFQGPKTIAHGDFRSENILFGANEAAIVDWQTVCESSVMTDLAYFLGGSVEIEQRREWERGLVEDYSAQINNAGVALSVEDCWNQYREFAMHGIMITVLGACFTAAEERSDRMFLAMIQRHLQQCIDLGAGEFLPS